MKRRVKVCMVGEYGVGKTTLLYGFLNKDYAPQTTLGIDFFSRTFRVKHHDVHMNIWDTAGSERYKSMMHSYLRDSEIVVFVYDLSDASAMSHVDSWMRVIESHKPSVVTVVGNKTDLQKGTHEDIQRMLEPWKRQDWTFVTGTTSKYRPEEFQSLLKKSLEIIVKDSPEVDRISLVIEAKAFQQPKQTCCS